MEDIKKPDKKEDDSKSLKKLLEAHTLVVQNKLGRAPTLQELTDSLQDNIPEEQKQDKPQIEDVVEGEPKILKLKIFYGMGDKDGSRVPDKHKVLFYETGDGKVYDCNSGSWMPNRPPVLDHLQSRPIEYDESGRDIMRAMVHGVVDDEDYNALDQTGILSEEAKKLFALYKNVSDLKNQSQSLEKSEEVPSDEKKEPEYYSMDATEGHEPKTSSIFQGISMKEKSEVTNEIGENVIQQIMSVAMEEIKTMTEEMVKEEIVRFIKPLSEAVHAIAEHLGLVEIAAESEDNVLTDDGENANIITDEI